MALMRVWMTPASSGMPAKLQAKASCSGVVFDVSTCCMLTSCARGIAACGNSGGDLVGAKRGPDRSPCLRDAMRRPAEQHLGKGHFRVRCSLHGRLLCRARRLHAGAFVFHVMTLVDRPDAEVGEEA